MDLLKRAYLIQLCIALLQVFFGTGCWDRPMNNTLQIHLPAVPRTLDPHQMDDMYSMLIAIQMHRGLLRYLPDGSVAPDLADHWEESVDHLQFKFFLRAATFSDGSRITAQNVVQSFRRLFLRRSSMATDLAYIRGAKDLMSGRNSGPFGVSAPSEDTVLFDLEHVSSLFLKHLAAADCAVLPITSTSNPADFTVDYKTPSAGPYKLASQNSDEISLQKWRPDLRDSKNPPRVIRFFRGRDNMLKTALEEGTDCLANDTLRPEDVEMLEGRGWHVVAGAVDTERFVLLDPARISKQTRKWMRSRLDVDALLKSIGEGRLTAAFGLVPSSLPGHLTASDVKIFKAERISGPLKESVALEFNAEDPAAAKIAKYAKEAWAHPSLHVALVPRDAKTYLARMFGSKAQALIARKGLDYPDGYATLAYFKSDAEGSYFYFQSKVIDEGLKEALNSLDEQVRAKIYNRLQISILNATTVLPLTFGPTESGLWSRRARVVPAHPMGFHTIPLEMIEMN